jgi:hypothetical protein
MRTTCRPVAFVFAGLLAACGGASGGGNSLPAPAVSAREPATGALVADAPYVKVTFSEAMDPASVTSGLGVSRDGGGPVAGTVTGGGAEWYFTPSLPFPAAATLRVSLSAGILSARGGRLDLAQSWSFDTAHWRELPLTGAPTARSQHTAVWTGTEAIVWGGTPLTRAGGRYNPATNSWLPTSAIGAPVGRTGHSAIWTGTEMIVWGGTIAGASVADGGRYNPGTDTWRTMSASGAPTARSGHTAVWTGGRMVVWGATGDLSGALYDPITDSWAPMTSTGAPLITSDHRAAWAGSKMIVWGGTYLPPPPPGSEGGAGICCPDYSTNAGGIYDPATDSWTAIPTTGGPTHRKDHALVWTGTELLIWGGAAGGNTLSPYSATGGRLSPAAGTWIPTADAGAPTARSQMHAAWTGARLLVWGGVSYGSITDGGLYDPVTESWAPIAELGGLTALQRGAASVWTGAELIVLGGETGAPGARFTP